MAARRAPSEPFALADALVEALATSSRINHYLLESVPEPAWRAEPPGGKGRTIAAIAAHVHNVRVMWIKVSGKAAGIPVPEQAKKETVTPAEAVVLLKDSDAALERLVREAIASGGRIHDFRPNVASFVGYVISHDAHHRGQIALLARQVGHPLPKTVGFGMWEWGKR